MTKTVIAIFWIITLVVWYVIPRSPGPISNHTDRGPLTNMNHAQGPERARAATAASGSGAESGPDPLSIVGQSVSAAPDVERWEGIEPALPGAPWLSSTESSTIYPEGAGEEPFSGLSISGTVHDREGYPLTTIEVLAEPIGAAGAGESNGQPTRAVRRSTWTDFDGAFHFHGLDAGEYLVQVAPMDGFATAETTTRAGAESVRLVLDWLEQVGISGTVRGLDGQPLEGVRIVAGPPSSISESGLDGAYALEIGVRQGRARQTLHFRRDGYRDHVERIDSEELAVSGGRLRMDVSLQPLDARTTVAGWVEDATGRPIAGETINLNSPKLNTRFRVRSDTSGHFAFEGVEPGKDYRLSIRPRSDFRDYQQDRLEVPDEGLQLGIILEPLGAGRLSGQMLDANGRPVPNFTMTLTSAEAASQSIRVVSDHAGFFEVQDFPEGSVILKTNSYPAFRVHGIRSSSGSEGAVPVILDLGPHDLRGRVTDELGEPVAVSEVSLEWRHDSNGLQSYSVRRTVADQQGNFTFTGLGPGAHTLRASAPGLGAVTMQIHVGPETGSIHLALNGGG